MENKLDLSNIFKIIKKNWGIWLFIPIIFLLISLIITFLFMTPKYEATTQILINQKDKNKELMAQEVQSNIQLVNTYSQILKSPRILDEVAKKDNKYSSDEINNMLSIDAESDSQILNVNVESKNKKDSEKIANEIAKVVSDEMPKIMSVDNVTILSKATGTAHKVSPKVPVNIAVAIILGLLVAILIIILKELLDKRIKTEEDVERELNIPVLGSIQKLK